MPMKKVSREELIADLQNVAKRLGRSPGRREYNKLGNHAHRSLENYFGSFNKAKVAAGLRPYCKNRNSIGGESILDVPALPILDQHKVIKGDVMLVADIQCPCHDAETMGRFRQIAERFKIRTAVILGDFLNYDRLSTFLRHDTVRAQEEVDTASKIIEWLFKWFKRVYWILGNHDSRLWLLLHNEFDQDHLARLVTTRVGKGVIVTEYPFAILKSGGQEWRLDHPHNYSRVPGSNPVRMVTKYRMSVVSGHNHLVGVQQDPSGLDFGVDLGTACDGSRVHFYQKTETNFPVWTRAFGMIRKGAFYHFVMDDHLTDWNFWLKESVK